MKNNFPLIARTAAVAVASGFLSCGSAVFAQESTESASPAATESPEPARGSSASADAKPGKTDTIAKSSPATKPDAVATISDSDRRFMQTAAKDGMKEVHMGQMAVKDGQSDEVKKLGSKIVADHTKANNQLMGIAEKKGVKLDLRHKMDKMSNDEMKNFDQAWLGMMVTDHEKDIAAFDKQVKSGSDPELKAFAKKTLPVLQNHLKMVKAAQSKLTAKKSS